MYAVLDGNKVVEISNLTRWVEDFEKDNRRVQYTEWGNVCISTVFLGIDHGFGAAPLWFETMRFEDPERRGHESGQWRCATYNEAILMHAEAVLQTLKEKGDGPLGDEVSSS